MVKGRRNTLGNDADHSIVVLLLIDVINDFQFAGGQGLLRPAMKAAANIAALKKRAKVAGIPSVYVNDNFGRWRSDFKKLVDNTLDNDTPGKPIVELLLPDPDDYFVLKPKHSAFHATPLDMLLVYLGAKILILTGLTADNCILATAADAHMLEYDLVVPSDCVAAATESQKRHALELIDKTLDGRTTKGRDLKLNVLARGHLPQRPRQSR